MAASGTHCHMATSSWRRPFFFRKPSRDSKRPGPKHACKKKNSSYRRPTVGCRWPTARPTVGLPYCEVQYCRWPAVLAYYRPTVGLPYCKVHLLP